MPSAKELIGRLFQPPPASHRLFSKEDVNSFGKKLQQIPDIKIPKANPIISTIFRSMPSTIQPLKVLTSKVGQKVAGFGGNSLTEDIRGKGRTIQRITEPDYLKKTIASAKQIPTQIRQQGLLNTFSNPAIEDSLNALDLVSGTGMARRGLLEAADRIPTTLKPGMINFKAFVPEVQNTQALVKRIMNIGEEDIDVMANYISMAKRLNKAKGPEKSVNELGNYLADYLGMKKDASIKTISRQFEEVLGLIDQLTGKGGYVRLGKSVSITSDLVKKLKYRPKNTMYVSPDGKVIKPKSQPKTTAGLDQMMDEVGNVIQGGVRQGEPGLMLPQGEMPSKPLALPQGQPMRLRARTKKEYVKLRAKHPNAIIEGQGPIKGSGKPIITPVLDKPSLDNLMLRKAELDEQFFSNSQDMEFGVKEGRNAISNKVAQLEAKGSQLVTEMLHSDNDLIRGMGNLLRGVSGNAGIGEDLINAGRRNLGQQDYGRMLSQKIYDTITGLVGKKSLNKLHTILDEDLYKSRGLDITKEADLNDQEKQALDMLRLVSDYINDDNFVRGRISEQKWMEGRGGKYLARAYEEFEYPPELSDVAKESGISLDLGQFKKRVDNAREDFIKDPAYLVSKRLQQSFFNDAITDFMGQVKSMGLASDVEKPGYIKLSDHAMYGELKNQWIAKEAMEQVKGVFFANKTANSVYDLLKKYDNWGIRRLQKQMLTAMNPVTRLGNKTGNYIFGWLTGIDPASMKISRHWAKTAIKNQDPLYRKAVESGVLGINYSKSDLVKMSEDMLRDVNPKQQGKLRPLFNRWMESYGKEDDITKMAAIRHWTQRGYSFEDAVKKTARGFQNYNSVGWMYHVASKVPFLGNPFVKFKGDLIRMLKNSAIDNPLGLATAIIGVNLIGNLSSKLSGETPEDKKTREGRPFAPRIPFTDISMEFQTPFGAVNAARLLGTYSYTGIGEDGGDWADFLPYNPKNKFNDPLTAPVAQVLEDKDFRGKSIKDPDANKFTGSTLSPEEQKANQGKFLARQYTPPFINSALDTKAAAEGKPDYYGRTRTPGQAALRMYPGIKVEQFGHKEAEAARQKQNEYDLKGYQAMQRNIKDVEKDFALGKITPEQYQQRIQHWTQQADSKAGITSKQGITIMYIGNDGKVKEADLSPIEAPKLIGNPTLDDIKISQYETKLRALKTDLIELYDAGRLSETAVTEQIEKIDTLLEAANGVQKSLKGSKSGSGSGGRKAKKITFQKLKTPPAMRARGKKKRAKLKTFKTPQLKVKPLKVNL